MECINVTPGYRDGHGLSLRVIKSPSLVSSVASSVAGSVVGYWRGITSTESQNQVFHVGINYENMEDSRSEVQNSLTLGM